MTFFIFNLDLMLFVLAVQSYFLLLINLLKGMKFLQLVLKK
jgi:hypothetical protein